MKKLNKLQINPARIMQNSELISLKGGDAPGSDNCCVCHAWDGSVIGYIHGTTSSACNQDCYNALHTGYGIWNCLV
jgi:hypothetical protein